MEKRSLEKRGLFRLKDLKDYEVAKSDPDVRGWNVFSGDDKTIGTVDELIVDPELEKVRYLDLHLNKDINRAESDRHLLIPIGYAELDEKRKAVKITTVETVTLLKMPEYEGGAISREYEKQVRRSIKPEEEIPETESEFYNNDLFDENRFYKSRKKRLYELKEIENTGILKNRPDIRGWSVFSSDGEKIGRVYELLIDKEYKKIRYMDILTDSGSVFDTESHILIPIGMASLGLNSDKILIDADSKDFSNYPVYNGEIVTREYENSLLHSITGSHEQLSEEKDNDYYSKKQYDDDRFFSDKK